VPTRAGRLTPGEREDAPLPRVVGPVVVVCLAPDLLRDDLLGPVEPSEVVLGLPRHDVEVLLQRGEVDARVGLDVCARVL